MGDAKWLDQYVVGLGSIEKRANLTWLRAPHGRILRLNLVAVIADQHQHGKAVSVGLHFYV